MKRLSLPCGEASTRPTTRLNLPAPGGVAELAVAAHLVSLAQGAGDSRVLGQIGNLGREDLVAGEAEDVADTVALAPRHGLGPAIVAVAAHQDLHSWPAGAEGFHDMPQDQGDL